MEWVCVYLSLAKNLPVLSARDDDYKTEEACMNANAGTSDTFWCLPACDSKDKARILASKKTMKVTVADAKS